ncbi:MAG: DNA polymerase III subunit delta [Planctomycetota bacterium]
MQVAYKDLASLLAGPPPTFVAIVGNEDWLRRDAVEKILRRVHSGPPNDEEITRLDGGKQLADPKRIVDLFDQLRTPSLFAAHSSIVVQRAEAYLEADPELWIEACSRPWQNATLILHLDSLDGRTRVGKSIEKHAWLIKIERPFHRPPPWKTGSKPWENELNSWIVAHARSLGLALDPPIAHLLQCRVGTSLSDLAAALERVSLTIPVGKVQSPSRAATLRAVDREIIEKLTPDGEESDVFELVDSFCSGASARARTLSLARNLVERGNADARGQRVFDGDAVLLQFIGAAIARVRQLRALHRALAQNADEQTILETLGIKRPFLPRLRIQARATPPTELDRLITELYRADRDFKSGRVSRSRELLERLALAPTSAPSAPSAPTRARS